MKVEQGRTKEWYDIPVNPMYEINENGVVRKKDTKRILKQHIRDKKQPYLSVHLGLKDKKCYRVHKLITEAILGGCPIGKEVNHKDGNKMNNNILNLEYVTRSQNGLHAYKYGLHHAISGESCHNAKLTVQDVKNIKTLKQTTKMGYRKIARQLGLPEIATKWVIMGKNWKGVE